MGAKNVENHRKTTRRCITKLYLAGEQNENGDGGDGGVLQDVKQTSGQPVHVHGHPGYTQQAARLSLQKPSILRSALYK